MTSTARPFAYRTRLSLLLTPLLATALLAAATSCQAGWRDLFSGGGAPAQASNAAAGASASLPSEELWGTDYKAALETAAKENKNVLLEFSGSDWCSPCIRLKKTLLSDPVFLDYARNNLALVNVDFPQTKSLPPDLVKQNDTLHELYGIDAFPTLVLITPQGKILMRVRGLPVTDAKGLVDQLSSASKQ
jgi:thioredoxin-related protein